MSFLKEAIPTLKNDRAGIADDGVLSDHDGFIDTGSYILNALISGSIYGGIPNNKITTLAGKQATGKTFYALSITKQFLNSDPNAEVIYFESESSVTREMLTSRGIDTKRIGIVPVNTIQEFRAQALRLCDSYLKLDVDKRPPLLFVLDSLGNLSTDKEMEDCLDDKDVTDMSRSRLVKSTFRVTTNKLAEARIPLLVTNHIYESMKAYSSDEMSGGSGLKYASSTIIFFTKSKERDGTNIVGNIIKCRADKSRFTRENSQVETRLFYDSRGLDRYYGLLELAEKYGVITKVGNRYKIGEQNLYPKTILADPDKYFTKDLLDKIDECAKKEFSYGEFEEDEDSSNAIDSALDNLPE